MKNCQKLSQLAADCKEEMKKNFSCDFFFFLSLFISIFRNWVQLKTLISSYSAPKNSLECNFLNSTFVQNTICLNTSFGCGPFTK